MIQANVEAMKSARASGPSDDHAEFHNASMLSRDATPSYNAKMASLIIGIRTRWKQNPESPDTPWNLPSRSSAHGLLRKSLRRSLPRE